jgi:hypothetical protein
MRALRDARKEHRPVQVVRRIACEHKFSQSPLKLLSTCLVDPALRRCRGKRFLKAAAVTGVGRWVAPSLWLPHEIRTRIRNRSSTR